MNALNSQSLMSAKTRLPVRNRVSEPANTKQMHDLIQSLSITTKTMTACNRENVIVLRTADFTTSKNLNAILENGIDQCKANARNNQLHTDPAISSVISLKTSDPKLAAKQENVARQAIKEASITREMDDNGMSILHVDIPRVNAMHALHMVTNLIGTNEKCDKTLSGLQVSWG